MRRIEYGSGENATVQLATRVPHMLHVRVRVNAIDSGVTMSEWVEDALEAHLARCKHRGRSGARTAPKAPTDDTGNAA